MASPGCTGPAGSGVGAVVVGVVGAEGATGASGAGASGAMGSVGVGAVSTGAAGVSGTTGASTGASTGTSVGGYEVAILSTVPGSTPALSKSSPVNVPASAAFNKPKSLIPYPINALAANGNAIFNKLPQLKLVSGLTGSVYFTAI